MGPSCVVGRPCVIRKDLGGYVVVYKDLARKIVENRIELRIDGVCASACTILADQARPWVCVTPRAVLKFHKSKDLAGPTKGRRSQVGFSPAVERWIAIRGGLPSDGLLVMSYAQARQLWPECSVDLDITHATPHQTTHS